MKFYVLTKKQLTVFGAVFLSFVILIIGVVNAFAVGDRRLPIYSVENTKKQIAISFDAAWGADDTDELIKILGEYEVPATFFVVGAWVDKYPDEVKKLHDAGHRVENHSNSHPYMTKLSTDKMIEELRICNEKIASVTGRKPLLFRPPYGDYSNPVIESVESQNMFTIQWSIDSLDWQSNASVQSIINNCTSKTEAGDIILMHNDAEFTPSALPTVLKTLQDKGFRFVLIEDLILKENYKLDHTGRQCRI